VACMQHGGPAPPTTAAAEAPPATSSSAAKAGTSTAAAGGGGAAADTTAPAASARASSQAALAATPLSSLKRELIQWREGFAKVNGRQPELADLAGDERIVDVLKTYQRKMAPTPAEVVGAGEFINVLTYIAFTHSALLSKLMKTVEPSIH
jgi:hypothetical protein